MSAPTLLIVTDALIANMANAEELSYQPHPSLQSWQGELERCSKKWFEATPKTAIEWYAVVTGNNLSSLLTPLFDQQEIEGFTQFWIASPFHARLNRDRLQVMPDAYFSWSKSDAIWICDLLNPLLNEEGMKLIHYQASLILLCRNALDAAPLSFAAISGHTLPNRHPEGADGGALMRLTAEIQMMMNQHPSETRKAAGEADVDGLWFWGSSMINALPEIELTPVATRNPLLRSIADAKDAGVLITEADHLPGLVKAGQPLPKRVLLTGGDHALLLTKSILPTFGKPPWVPKREKEESDLFKSLKGFIHAA